MGEQVLIVAMSLLMGMVSYESDSDMVVHNSEKEIICYDTKALEEDTIYEKDYINSEGRLYVVETEPTVYYAKEDGNFLFGSKDFKVEEGNFETSYGYLKNHIHVAFGKTIYNGEKYLVFGPYNAKWILSKAENFTLEPVDEFEEPEMPDKYVNTKYPPYSTAAMLDDEKLELYIELVLPEFESKFDFYHMLYEDQRIGYAVDTGRMVYKEEEEFDYSSLPREFWLKLSGMRTH